MRYQGTITIDKTVGSSPYSPEGTGRNPWTGTSEARWQRELEGPNDSRPFEARGTRRLEAIGGLRPSRAQATRTQGGQALDDLMASRVREPCRLDDLGG
ncbi:hypothetical protein CDL15_Pgr010528 [Punica granatum]|uniref:Uncharacterized protein n=1 Tax=Punica granatum TaxID=22663 RepID=A0A218XXK1_PUNGR|nr:hypothetical protein CDL15_Pgr010528 [Punica granatum]PKI67792.1 hypothetical protein CRG98_011842 [Punica granatum]